MQKKDRKVIINFPIEYKEQYKEMDLMMMGIDDPLTILTPISKKIKTLTETFYIEKATTEFSVVTLSIQKVFALERLTGSCLIVYFQGISAS